MKKLYMIGATTVSGIVLAMSLSSPAFAQYSSGQTAMTSQTSTASSRHDHGSESNDKNHESNDSHGDNHGQGETEHNGDHASGHDQNEHENEHKDCEHEDHDNHGHNRGHGHSSSKHGSDKTSKDSCDKAVVAVASSQTASAISNTDTALSQPTTLPNAGPGDMILIGTVVAAAGYAANVLRFKYRVQQ